MNIEVKTMVLEIGTEERFDGDPIIIETDDSLPQYVEVVRFFVDTRNMYRFQAQQIDDQRLIPVWYATGRDDSLDGTVTVTEELSIKIEGGHPWPTGMANTMAALAAVTGRTHLSVMKYYQVIEKRRPNGSPLGELYIEKKYKGMEVM